MVIFVITVMLERFGEARIEKLAIAGRLIEEVEIRPEHVSTSCLDEKVCLRNVQKYFTYDGWKALLDVVEAVKKRQYGFVVDVQI